MKRLLPLLFLIISIQAFAATPKETFKAANKQYESQNYPQAISLYESVLGQGLESPELYYNLGDAYYRQGELARAIINFERAHRLDPADRDTRENLDFVYSKTEDQIHSMPRLFLLNWWNAIVEMTSLRGWLNICLICLALTCTAIVLFFLSREYAWRKGSMILSFVLTALLLLSGACTLAANQKKTSTNHAIITAPLTVVKSSPNENGVDKLVLHEGTKVRIEGEEGGWSKVRIADGNHGWMQTTDIEII